MDGQSHMIFIEIDEGEHILEIDLGAERVLAAERGDEQIAIEINLLPLLLS